MSLIFKDEHIKCSNCSSVLFEESQVFGIEPLISKDNELDLVYKPIQIEYIIRCVKCREVIAGNAKSIITNTRE